MAITKTSLVLIAAAAAAPGSTKASPAIAGAAVDVRGHYSGLLTYSIANGATAPGAAVILTFQVSSDGAAWRDLWTVSGDTVAGSTPSGCIDVPRAAMFVRAIAYGNTVQSVSVAVELQAVTAL